MPIDYHNDGANAVNAFLFLDNLKKNTHNRHLRKKRKVKKKIIHKFAASCTNTLFIHLLSTI